MAWTGLTAGTTDVRLTITDATGETATATTSVEVLAQDCPTALDPVLLGALGDAELVESSGLIVSRLDPAVLWSHNDSGDTARLFALGRDGTALGTWTLDVADGDWEDLAWATDDETGAPQLYIGDIGSNGLSRDTVLVYIVDEPTVDTTAAPDAHPVETWRTLTLHMPEVLNLDSMLVDPVTGDLVLISDATDGRAVILTKPAPHTDGEDVTLTSAGELVFGGDALPGDTLAMGADISPLGDRIVIRTRTEAWLWRRDGAQTVAETLLGAEPCPITLPTQTLGEAVALDPRDGGLLVTSEGTGEPIYQVPFEEADACIDTLQAVITATPPGGPLPVDVVLDASASCAPEGLASVAWDINGELYTDASVSTSWLASGDYPVTLTITDALGATASTSGTLTIEPGDCPEDDGSEALGVLEDETLIETSGIAASPTDPDLLWVHNDGNDPVLYAVSRSGATLGTWTLDTTGRDIEDLALGYAEDGTPELWLADVGDNAAARENIALLRTDEPSVPSGDPEDHTVYDFDTITLTYPDGPHNCETILVDPVTRDIFLVTKSPDGLSGVYRKAAPHTDGEVAELELITTLTFSGTDGAQLTTGGAFSPDGAWAVIRTYSSTAYIWRRDQSDTITAAFDSDPCPVSLPALFQGEAICFDTDGDALLIVSEGEASPIDRVPLVR